MPTSHARRRDDSTRRLDSHDNSLNLVRLLLASSVVVSHTFVLGAFGAQPMIGRQTLGTWAVYGFFCLSGFLVMGSRQRYRVGEFMTHRLARIYPGYIVCTILTVAVLAPVVYVVDRGGIGGYLTAHGTPPLSYLWGNAFLQMQSYDVAGTLHSVPYANVWNGSLWSLHYEFLCYLMLAVLGWWGPFRRSPLVVGALFALSVAAFSKAGTVQSYVTQNDIPLLLSLIPLFLGGSLVFLLRHELRISFPGALIAAAATTIATWQLPDWGPQLSAPAITYVLLWLGSVLPSHRLLRTHDMSYGMYIYAFPAQQLLVLNGAHAVGAPLFIVLSLAATIPFAVASWLLVERPAMRLTRRRRHTVEADVSASAAPAR